MATPPIPVIAKNENVQGGSSTDFQSSVNAFAESSNHLSAIGAQVAQSANNQMAAQLGYEAGKTPHGNLTPSITEFDKNFAESYKTQANATLSIQGHRLLTDAKVKLSEPNRLTPELIASTNSQVQRGLDKIASNAPTEIRGQLEANFASQLMNQDAQFKEKMISQQREDQKNNILNALDLYNKTANELASTGNYPAALRLVEIAKKTADSAHASAFLTREQARVAYDSTHQSYINGRHIFEATNAYNQGRYAEYQKEFARERHGLTNEQYLAAGKAFTDQINFLEHLKSQEQTLQAVRFEQEIAEDVNGITGARTALLKSQVSPLQYEKLQLEYIKAKKIFNTQRAASRSIIAGFSDPNVFGRGTTKEKNNAFDDLVYQDMKTMENAGTPISIEESQVRIARRAAGAVPGYLDVLNTKLASKNPVDVETAGKSIAAIFNAGKGANLEGLNPKSNAMYEMYQALRRSKNPQEAAEEAYNAVYNQKPEEKKVVEDAWADELKQFKSDGKLKEYTNLAGVNSKNLVDPLGYVEQVENILHSNYVLTKGDLDTAKKMTANIIKNTYGESHVNGRKETTFYPLETAVGIPADGAGYIQDDVIEYVNEQLKSTKVAFDAGSLDYYWEVEPRRSLENIKNEKHGFESPNITLAREQSHKQKFETGSEMIIHKHYKNGVRETYPLIIKADPWLSKAANPTKPYTAGWDIVLGTKTGIKPLPRVNPMMDQVIVYKPDVKKIHERYMKDHGLKG